MLQLGALVLTGFCGGVLTSFAGCGLDIFSYSVLTLLFRVSEKVATPTAVTLMGVNSVFSSYWRTFVMQETSRDALLYVVVCIPIVVIGAPFGSLVGSHFHRYGANFGEGVAAKSVKRCPTFT